MYIIIDWHYIGNIENGKGSHMPDIDIEPKDYSIQFWKQVANYYKDTPNVIIENFNEPANITADSWSKNAKEIIRIIKKSKCKTDYYSWGYLR